jgi:predicted aspartyl protease
MGVAELDERLGAAGVMGRRTYTHILVSDDVDAVLIGVVTTEALGLEVDPVTGEPGGAGTYLP